jgi:Raf kinase inhibitor-like YbhB/YbcL family protein
VRLRVALLVTFCVAFVLTSCGDDQPLRPPPSVTGSAGAIGVTSPAFADGAAIPERFTCHGAGTAPDVAWRGVPDGTASVALVVSDPDAPDGTYVHWVVYDLPAADGVLNGGRVPGAAREAKNSGGDEGWTAPCPPSGTHRYVFTVYALRQQATGDSTQDLLDDIGRQALASGALTGLVTST